uniref:Mitochondrial carrier protein n=1 Tax=Anopheles atroparvus TaxID=41427 RepID=A0AAG5CVP2_ANOAO
MEENNNGISPILCDFIAGSFGGACGLLVGHPMDTIKAWQQNSNYGMGNAMYNIIIRNNGLKGFYRGMYFPLLSNGALNSVVFAVYGSHLRYLQKHTRSDRLRKAYWRKHVFIAGSMAGLAQVFLACPIEVVKVRLQTLSSSRLFRFSVARQSYRTPVGLPERHLPARGPVGDIPRHHADDVPGRATVRRVHVRVRVHAGDRAAIAPSEQGPRCRCVDRRCAAGVTDRDRGRHRRHRLLDVHRSVRRGEDGHAGGNRSLRAQEHDALLPVAGEETRLALAVPWQLGDHSPSGPRQLGHLPGLRVLSGEVPQRLRHTMMLPATKPFYA